MALAETARLAVRIDLEGNASKGVQKLNRQIGGLGSSVARVGKGVGQVGAGFARAGLVAGGAAVAGLTAIAKAAIDFDDAFAGVRKTVSQTDLDKAGLTFADLEKSLRGLATTIPISAVQLAQLGEAAGALGVKAQDIVEFTRVTAELGVTTDLTADAAGEALGKIGTILNLTGKDYEKFADVLVNLGNNGASTESAIIEVTKRFAAAGHQAGLATPEILALASAVSSMGIEPEAAGGALSRVFNQMAQNIALANTKGKEFAKITGHSLEQLQADINKGKGLDVFQDFLKGLQGLSKTDFQKALKKAGITNTRDINAILLMAQNMGFFNDQLEIAKNSAGALEREASIKFDTIRSKLTLLKNSAIEAALTIGGDPKDPKSFIGSIGVAAQKLTTFLNDPANKSELAAFGSELGAAISNINWDDVLKNARSFVGVLKTTFGIVMDIVGAVNKLPSEVKAAAAALLVLNKASGGLIGTGVGNIVGGLVQSIIRGIGSKIPVVGSLFAQPVFVTNWPVGGLGGGLPGGAGAGAVGAGVTSVAAGVGALITSAVAAAVIGVLQADATFGDQNDAFDRAGLTPAEVAAQRYYNASKTDQQTIIKRLGYLPSKSDFESGNKKLTAAIQNGPKNITGGPDDRHGPVKPPPGTVGHGSTPPGRREYNRSQTTLAKNVKDVRDKVESAKIAQVSAISKAKNATDSVRDRVESAKVAGVSATHQGSASIVGAIYANRPIITTNVSVSATNVTKVTNVQKNYGNNHPSRNADPNKSYGGGV